MLNKSMSVFYCHNIFGLLYKKVIEMMERRERKCKQLLDILRKREDTVN